MNNEDPAYGEIDKSGLFSAAWYLARYQDVAAANLDPLEHYLLYGVSEGRDPGPDFSTSGYLARYRDVAEADINPLLHYIRYGKKEGRLTTPCLDPHTIKRPYGSFAEYLTGCMLDPLVKAPFAALDLDNFKLMDQVARWLCLKQKECQESPLVSVIMPMRDRAEVVGDAVRSVLAQSYINLELIVVDDGSRDDSLAVVRGFTDPRIRLLARRRAGGVSAARNRGLAAARGELIAYLDSDNSWRADYLCAMAGVFQVRPDADAAYGGQVLYRGMASEPFAVRFGCYNPSLLRNRNYIDLNCFVHRRAVLKAAGGGFCEAIKRWVDWELILRIARVGKIYSVPILQSNYFLDKAANTITAVEALQPAREAIMAKWGYDSPRGVNREHAGLVTVVTGPGSDLFQAIDLALDGADPASDLLLLNPEATLMPGTLSALQTAAYADDSIAMAVPQQVQPGGRTTINTHVPYAFSDVPCDVTLSQQHRNVEALPLLHGGGMIDLNFAPFGCVYIRREVWEMYSGVAVGKEGNRQLERNMCDFVRHVLDRRIVYIPEAVAFFRN
jgi:GT2 family glycosyltransferase